MVSDDFVEWAIKGLLGAGGVFGLWFVKKTDAKVVALETRMIDRASASDIALANHRLESEKTYANKAEMQASLARVHDRVDETHAMIRAMPQEISSQIIALLDARGGKR